MTTPRRPPDSRVELAAIESGLSRRSFLRTTLWFGVAATAAAAGGFAWLRRSPADALPLPAGIRHLSATHYQLVDKLARVILPVAGTDLPALTQVPVAARVDRLLDGLRPDIRQQLFMGFTLFDNLSVLSGGHYGRYVDLPDDAAAAYLDRWMNSSLYPLRAIASAAARLVKTGYWTDTATWAALGYPGPVTRVRGIPALGNAPLPGGAS